MPDGYKYVLVLYYDGVLDFRDDFALPAERREHFGWRLTACTVVLLGFSLLLFFCRGEIMS